MIDEEATFKKFGYYSTDLSPKSNKKIVAVCDDCGKVRTNFKYAYHALCHSCARKHQRGENNPSWKGGKVKRVCKQCGKVRYFTPAVVKRGGGKFCTRKCTDKWKSKHNRGKNSPSWKGGKVMRICEICGTVFPAVLANTKMGKGRFCSPKCHGKWLSKYHRGENNGNWKGGASFEPYCVKFNPEFKEYIRDKFGRVCFLCSKTEKENGKRLSVHHVNYNKDCGCDEDKTCQFVPLCIGCNAKVNSNRKMWEKKIKDRMKNKLNGWYI